ncbi:MAG: hypothetical protein A4E29_01655 [Methanomassiliicoccales archaeon PtaB.Bin134]|jgi:uncharacterized protein YdeI (YjbR/CyaY-like superfamily)|nr:MAG: hypothetical protein A4E29_01655 [Methanomassiliicoccales archaeon PtaB.Bin134]
MVEVTRISSKRPKEHETLSFQDRQEWELWLQQNHSSADGIWMLFHRKEFGRPGIGYREALEEALRFGWIDSIVKKLDEERYVRKFTPRKASSRWSRTNLEIVRHLMAEGRMTERGMTALGDLDERLSLLMDDAPTEDQMSSLFLDEPDLRRTFDSLPPSQRRRYAAWIFDAKRVETRARRAAKAAQMIMEGRPPIV